MPRISPSIRVFLKKKREDLNHLVRFFEQPPSVDHGLHGYISPDVLKQGAFQLATHTFCCYALLKPHLALLDTVYLLPKAEGDRDMQWASRSILTDTGIALLEHQASWLTLEIELVIKEIVKWNLLLQDTCAPEQLITQWYIEQLFTGLELLRSSALEITAEDMEGVRGMFDEGENCLAKEALRLV